eukprot:GHVO01066097.1.p1 GENE.GHVO01066097.1~~GHVO01066097.1.p1  ORF type:complete len:266 (-),score=48.10 GHVO01066097.1:44-820(-)
MSKLEKHETDRIKQLDSVDRHALFSKWAMASTKLKSDHELLTEAHEFLWEDYQQPSSWEEKLAKAYYDRLYKEYALADLTKYKTGQIGLRWRTQKEVIHGKGQFVCGNLACEVRQQNALKSYEVNFKYKEKGMRKNALVKLRLCGKCAAKLHYKSLRRRKRRLHKELRTGKKHKPVAEANETCHKEDTHSEESQEDDEPSEEVAVKEEEDGSDAEGEEALSDEALHARIEREIWKAPIEETAKPEAEEYDSYFENMFL